MTQEHGECHVWDMGTWRTPRVGHRDVEGATCGTQGRRGCHVWDTGAWRVKRVGHGGVEGATCGTHQRPHMLQGAMPCQEPSGP